MSTPRGTLPIATLYRDMAIGGAGTAALVLHILGQSWLPAALAVAGAAAWIIAERRDLSMTPWASQVIFVLIGTLSVWRFRENLLWLSTAGIWILVAAADLSRLCRRFPVDASPLDQRLHLSRRLQHLAILGVVSAALVGATLVLTLSLRLTAVSLLALFVVIVAVRMVRSVASGELPGDDDEPRG